MNVQRDVFNAEEFKDLVEGGYLRLNRVEVNRREELWADFHRECGTTDEDGERWLIHPDNIYWESIISLEVKRIGWDKISFIVGTAGTGKTFEVSRIMKEHPHDATTIFPLAPSGVACENLATALRAAQASDVAPRVETPHSRFRLVDENGTFEGMPLWWGGRVTPKGKPSSLYVFDEVFFWDLRTLATSLTRIPPGARLVMCGDPYQLPPVGPGEAAYHLLKAAPEECVTRLTVVHRSKEGSEAITEAAKQILCGEWPQPMGGYGWRVSKADDFSEMLESAMNYLDDGFQVICPTNKLAMMVGRMHAARRHLKAGKKDEEGRDTPEGYFHRGDKVRIRRGDRSKRVRTGEIAIWHRYDAYGGYHVLSLPAREGDKNPNARKFNLKVPDAIRYRIQEDLLHFRTTGGLRGSEDELMGLLEGTSEEASTGLLTHANAITVHSAQGSQWNRVLVLAPGLCRPLSRSWFYVAATRARVECVVMLCEGKVKGAIVEAVKCSLLTERRRLPKKATV